MKKSGSAVTYFNQPNSSPNKNNGDVINVVLVDDSSVVRSVLSNWFIEDTEIQLSGIYTDGQKLVDALPSLKADIIILDIEMPRMDGITALPHILKAMPDVDVIIASSLSRRGAEITMKALEKGAKDYIAKPSVGHRSDIREQFQNDLISKIKLLYSEKKSKHNKKLRSNSFKSFNNSDRKTLQPTDTKLSRKNNALKDNATSNMIKSKENPPVSSKPVLKSPVAIKSPSISNLKIYSKPDIIVIGSSTGGPTALVELFENISAVIDTTPILIAQHMPPMFTQIMAEHLARTCKRPVFEPSDGDFLSPGKAYVAPGGKHMGIAQKGARIAIEINENPPIAHCRPSVDYLFKSVAAIYGSNTLGIILTGMGSDGAEGSLNIKEKGGEILVQDKESSAVWGMPHAACTIGAEPEILTIAEISNHLNLNRKVNAYEPRARTISL